MRTEWYAGVVTALSSISHIGPDVGAGQGVTSYLRREKFVQPDGTVEEIPVISGNGMRGLLRDLGMWHMCGALGYGVNSETGEVEGLSLPAFHFLFSGGTLTKTEGRGLDIAVARRIKEMIPLVGLFGGAVGNQIIEGKLKIGKLIPICRETAHLMPDWCLPEDDRPPSLQDMQGLWEYETNPRSVAETVARLIYRNVRQKGTSHVSMRNICIDEYYVADVIKEALESHAGEIVPPPIDEVMKAILPYLEKPLKELGIGSHHTRRRPSPMLASIFDLVQQEAFARKDDEKNERLRQLIAPEARALLESVRQEKLAKKAEGKEADDEVGQHQQMRYYVETLAAGTPFFWEIALTDVTDVEYDAFWTCLALFAKAPYIGGKSGTGHGKVKIDFRDWMCIDPNRYTTETMPAAAMGTRYQEHLRDRGADIRELLASWQ